MIVPIEVTVVGMVTAVSELHPAKVFEPIAVTPVGIVTDISLEHHSNA